MSAGTAKPLTVIGLSQRATHESTRHAWTSTASSFRAPAEDGKRLPLTEEEGVVVDAVRCPYCNLPMFVDRATRHCTHCDWRLCPACHRHYSLKKAPVHEIEE